jgi:hypothetical protein
MNKVVEFSGLNFASPDAVCKDGDAAMLINLRKKDGVLQIVPRPTITENVFNTRYTRRVFAHKVGTRTNYIAYQGLESTLITAFIPTAFDETGEGIAFKEQTIVENVTLNDFAVLANKVILVTAEGLLFATFENDNYVVSSDKLSLATEWPDIHFFMIEEVNPDLTYAPEVNLSSPWTNSFLPDGGWTDGGIYRFVLEEQDAATLAKNVIPTYYNPLKKIVDEKSPNALYGAVVVRYAIKLLDGNYIQHSPPILVLPSRRNPFIPPAQINSRGLTKQDPITNLYFGYDPDTKTYPSSTIYPSVIKIFADYDLSAWKDSIASVDVFLSPQIPLIDEEKLLSHLTITSKLRDQPGIDIYNVSITLDSSDIQYTTDELREKIIATDTFYKVRSLPLKYSAGADGELLDLTNVLSNLEQQPALPADELTHHALTGTTALMYNKRLHLGGITRHLAAPFPFEFFKVYAQGAQYVGPGDEDYFGQRYTFPSPLGASKYRMQVTISTPEGVKYTDVTPSDDNVIYSLYSPYVSYPDNRATALTIYYDSVDPDLYTPRKARITIPLVPHPSLNLAYYLTPQLQPLGYKEAAVWDETPPPTPTPTDTDLTVVRVSEVGNPYYFPAENTYSFGAPIVAMAPNTAPLSTGQFGQHPLYIFTEDGIYALGTGNGAITYANVVPVSRDICTNKLLLQTDDSIVFISSQGLMSIRGSVVTHLSAAIDTGAPPQPELFHEDMVKVLTYYPLVGLPGYLIRDLCPFKLFLDSGDGAVLGYNYAEREIYVMNKNLRAPTSLTGRPESGISSTSGITRRMTFLRGLSKTLIPRCKGTREERSSI